MSRLGKYGFMSSASPMVKKLGECKYTSALYCQRARTPPLNVGGICIAHRITASSCAMKNIKFIIDLIERARREIRMYV